MNSKKSLLTFAVMTGLAFSFAGPAQAAQEFDLGEYVVQAAPQQQEATEAPAERTADTNLNNAYAGGQVANSNLMGSLGRQKFIDTPFNVTGYTAELMANKQANNVTDVVKNDASVKDMSLSGANSAWTIRGFKTTQQDMQFNGLYGVAPRFYTGTEAYERVEVIKGPSALLGGMAPNGSIGGTINFVPKRATAEPINRVRLSYGNGSLFTQHVDIGRRFGDNNKYGVRVNVLNRTGETSVSGEKNNASTVSIGGDMRADRYRVALDLGYIYNEIKNPQYRVQVLDAALSGYTKSDPFTMYKADNNRKFGADNTWRRVTEKYGVVSGEYDLNKDWTAYAALGLRSTSMDYFYNDFVIRDSVATGVSRSTYRYNNQIGKSFATEAGVRGKVTTGSVTHNISVAASRLQYDRYMANRTFNTKRNFREGNFFTGWTQEANITGDRTWRSPLNDSNIISGISVTDRIATKDEKWQFILGGRYQKVKTSTYRINFPTVTGTNWNNGNAPTNYNDSTFSPAFGIVHKFNDKVSVYANYMEGLEAGQTTPNEEGVRNPNQVLAPVKSKQYEVGAKFDMGKFAGTVSAFQIKNPAIAPDTDGYYGLNTELRSRGIEFNVFGEPVKGTRVLGGVMLLDAKYTKDKTSQGRVGNRYPGTARVNAVLGLEQDIKAVKGLTMTTRLNYTGEAYTNDTNTMRVPSYLTWDLGARYTWKNGETPMTVRADVYNVLDKSYWNALDRGAVMLGNGRTFMLSLTANI